MSQSKTKAKKKEVVWGNVGNIGGRPKCRNNRMVGQQSFVKSLTCMLRSSAREIKTLKGRRTEDEHQSFVCH